MAQLEKYFIIAGQRDASVAPGVLRLTLTIATGRCAKDDKFNMPMPTQRRSDYMLHTGSRFVRAPGKTVESTVTAG